MALVSQSPILIQLLRQQEANFLFSQTELRAKAQMEKYTLVQGEVFQRLHPCSPRAKQEEVQ